MARNLTSLTLGTLEQLDPAIGALVAKHLRYVQDDMKNRPDDKSPREINIKLSFEPVMDDQRFLKNAAMKVTANSKVPKFVTPVYSVKADGREMSFSSDFADSVDQQPLPFAEQT
jgi:hypothetical protein